VGIFERYLSVWVGLSILVGLLLGTVSPSVFVTLADLELAGVNILVAVLIWVMIYPMMVQVDFKSILTIEGSTKGYALTVGINWLVKPFTMAFLAWVFFKIFFADLVTAEDANEYIAGMILLGVAPCTAMVFVWSQLTKGDPNFTLVQVALNDIILIFAFAPIAGLLLGISDITVPWDTLVFSVLLFVVVPLIAGIATRWAITKGSNGDLDKFLAAIKPASVVGLLATVVVLFGFQSEKIINQPFVILLISIPLVIQTYGIFLISYLAAKRLYLRHAIAAPSCLIGTSNFFELAVAVAISLFGLNSGAALATVVGVLVEVPVMLSLVGVTNRSRKWFESRSESNVV